MLHCNGQNGDGGDDQCIVMVRLVMVVMASRFQRKTKPTYFIILFSLQPIVDPLCGLIFHGYDDKLILALQMNTTMN